MYLISAEREKSTVFCAVGGDGNDMPCGDHGAARHPCIRQGKPYRPADYFFRVELSNLEAIP
jgi:hypothetical protein